MNGRLLRLPEPHAVLEGAVLVAPDPAPHNGFPTHFSVVPRMLVSARRPANHFTTGAPSTPPDFPGILPAKRLIQASPPDDPARLLPRIPPLFRHVI